MTILSFSPNPNSNQMTSIGPSRSPLLPLELNSCVVDRVNLDVVNSPGVNVRGGSGKPLKLLFKQGLLPITSYSPSSSCNSTLNFNDKDVVLSGTGSIGVGGNNGDGKIESEIEEVEREMSRLAEKLELLRLEKEGKCAKTIKYEDTMLGSKGILDNEVGIDGNTLKLIFVEKEGICVKNRIVVDEKIWENKGGIVVENVGEIDDKKLGLNVVNEGKCLDVLGGESLEKNEGLNELKNVKEGKCRKFGWKGITFGSTDIVGNVKVEPDMSSVKGKRLAFGGDDGIRMGRRGVSIGPVEIIGNVSRNKVNSEIGSLLHKGYSCGVGASNGLGQKGVSIGPSEIIGNVGREKNVKSWIDSFPAKGAQFGNGGGGISGRRGMSMGPVEIAASVKSGQKLRPDVTPFPIEGAQFGGDGSNISGRRVMSMGPAEISASVKSQQKVKPEVIQVVANGKLLGADTSTKPVKRGASIGPSGIFAGVSSLRKKNMETTMFDATGFQSASNSSSQSARRGITMGPLEIMAGTKSLRKVQPAMSPFETKGWESGPGTTRKDSRRGISMLPSEISAGVRSLQKEKHVMTPFQAKGWQSGPALSSKSDRRGASIRPSEISAALKSQQRTKPNISPDHLKDFQKPRLSKSQEDVEENARTKTGDKRLSLNPKSRLSLPKIRNNKSGLKTSAPNKPLNKEDGALSNTKSKKIVNEGEKSAVRKSLTKTPRVIPSRYNQIPMIPMHSSRKLSQADQCKKLVLENYDIDSMGKSAGSSLDCDWSETATQEIVGQESSVDTNSPTILKIADMLPKIRTIRCMNESPRDSGQAKRVADLIGRKMPFDPDDTDIKTSVARALIFDEEDTNIRGSGQFLSSGEEVSMDVETAGHILSNETNVETFKQTINIDCDEDMDVETSGQISSNDEEDIVFSF